MEKADVVVPPPSKKTRVRGVAAKRASIGSPSTLNVPAPVVGGDSEGADDIDLSWLDDLQSLLDHDANFMPMVVPPQDVAPEDDLRHHHHVTPAPPVVSTQNYVNYGWRQVQQHPWVPYHGQYHQPQPVVSVRRAEANMGSSMDTFSHLILSPYIA